MNIHIYIYIDFVRKASGTWICQMDFEELELGKAKILGKAGNGIFLSRGLGPAGVGL